MPLHASFNKGVANFSRGKYALAEENFHHAYDLFLSSQGPMSTDCLDAGMNLGVVLRVMGRYDEAEKYLEACRLGRLEVLGEGHVKTVDCLHNIAILNDTRGMNVTAHTIYEECIERYTALLGFDHPLTLEARSNSLGNKFHMGEKFAATKGMERVLKMKEEKLGPQSVSTLNSADNLACMYLRSAAEEELSLAGLLFERVEKGLISRLGEGHFEVAKTRENISIWHAKGGRFEEAVAYKDRAIEGYERVMGEGGKR
ncbi:hypothetical protein TrRE_jg12409, partial [Triparma retinervis]